MTLLETLQAKGIRRKGTPKSGFRYVHSDGRPVSRADEERIRELTLPPAWTDVHIATSPRSKLQAIGRDKAGRWQYRYHPSFLRKQEARKYQRLVHFAQALPKLRRRLEADLRKKGLQRDRVMAGILRILACCFMRPGSEAYAAENGSIGVATLRRRHVQVKGDRVTFDFPGKSGQRQVRELRDRRVARLIRDCLEVPGRDVFKFVTGDGAVIDVRRRHINAYIAEVMGEKFSAKDFRTWAGTLICACALARAGWPEGASRREVKRRVNAAVKETAKHLGNTPAVSRSSYISPTVFNRFEEGKVVERYFEKVDEIAKYDGHALHTSEKALVKLIAEAAR